MNVELDYDGKFARRASRRNRENNKRLKIGTNPSLGYHQ